MIANREFGANEGTVHLQGYIEFNHSVALSYLRNWQPRGHFEIRKGTQFEAIKYCCKDLLDDSIPGVESFENSRLGDLDLMGLQLFGIDEDLKLCEFLESLNTTRVSKLAEMVKMIDNGASDKDLALFDIDVWARSYRALSQYRLITVPERSWEMEVVVIYGPTGTGKSRLACEENPGCYWKQRGKWWDNYISQEVVVLDEFYGWLSWDVLLRMCDRYPMLVETKGGQTQFAAKKIIFTTNSEPCTWYENVYFPAFVRRVTSWIFMPECDVKHVYTQYRDFLININNTQLNSVQ